MFNLRLTAPVVEIPLKSAIGKFTTLKKLTFPRGGEIHIILVDIAESKLTIKVSVNQSQSDKEAHQPNTPKTKQRQ